MLEERLFDAGDGSHLIELPTKVVLPVSEEEFLGKFGLLPSMPGDLRRFQRRYLRCKAPFRILTALPAFPRDSEACQVYTRDISIGGIGFMAHQQLFPSEQAVLSLPNIGERRIAITSCRYINPFCYEAGATFISPAKASG